LARSVKEEDIDLTEMPECGEIPSNEQEPSESRIKKFKERTQKWNDSNHKDVVDINSINLEDDVYDADDESRNGNVAFNVITIKPHEMRIWPIIEDCVKSTRSKVCDKFRIECVDNNTYFSIKIKVHAKDEDTALLCANYAESVLKEFLDEKIRSN
jgi:hypothetical protein